MSADDTCPCCGYEPEDYGHAELMAWLEEQERQGNTVKVALFTSGPTPESGNRMETAANDGQEG